MLLKLINLGIEFVQTNAGIAVMVMGIMAYVKKVSESFAWRKSWMLTVAAFALSFLFVIPETGIVVDYLAFVFQGLLLGLTVTGVYDALKK